MLSYIVGGEPRWIAIGMLLVIGLILTLAPVVYVMLERLQMVKVAAVGILILIAPSSSSPREDWAALPQIVTTAKIPTELGFALLLGALAFAGAGGGQNLCQSNWIRDKGFGMGKYVPRIMSPVRRAEGRAVHRLRLRADSRKHGAAGRWWRFANVEQLVTFVLITFITITFTSLLAYATVYGQDGLPNSVAFVQSEGLVLADKVGGWFGRAVLVHRRLLALARRPASSTTRRACPPTCCAPPTCEGANESRLYFRIVWGLVAIGIAVLLFA